MFNNIGNKIKTLAKVVCYLGIALSCIFGLVIFSEALNGKSEDVLIGFLTSILVAGIGSLLSWTSSFTLYGFGELIHSNDNMAQNIYLIAEKFIDQKDVKSKIVQDSSTWICPECAFNNSNNSKQCCNCGFENLPQSEQMWTCPYCFQLNDSGKSTCTNCGKFRG